MASTYTATGINRLYSSLPTVGSGVTGLNIGNLPANCTIRIVFMYRPHQQSNLYIRGYENSAQTILATFRGSNTNDHVSGSTLYNRSGYFQGTNYFYPAYYYQDYDTTDAPVMLDVTLHNYNDETNHGPTLEAYTQYAYTGGSLPMITHSQAEINLSNSTNTINNMTFWLNNSAYYHYASYNVWVEGEHLN